MMGTCDFWAARPLVVGGRYVTQVFPGENFRVLPDGSILITHPDRPPHVIPAGEKRLLPPEEKT